MHIFKNLCLNLFSGTRCIADLPLDILYSVHSCPKASAVEAVWSSWQPTADISHSSRFLHYNIPHSGHCGSNTKETNYHIHCKWVVTARQTYTTVIRSPGPGSRSHSHAHINLINFLYAWELSLPSSVLPSHSCCQVMVVLFDSLQALWHWRLFSGSVLRDGAYPNITWWVLIFSPGHVTFLKSQIDSHVLIFVTYSYLSRAAVVTFFYQILGDIKNYLFVRLEREGAYGDSRQFLLDLAYNMPRLNTQYNFKCCQIIPKESLSVCAQVSVGTYFPLTTSLIDEQ